MTTRSVALSYTVNLTERIKADGTDRYLPVLFSATVASSLTMCMSPIRHGERHPTGNDYLGWSGRYSAKRKRESVCTNAAEAHNVHLNMQAGPSS
jgi:hypothetical protein